MVNTQQNRNEEQNRDKILQKRREKSTRGRRRLKMTDLRENEEVRDAEFRGKKGHCHKQKD